MKKGGWIALAVGLLFLGAAGFYAYERYGTRSINEGGDVLRRMPADASAVLYVNLVELRAAPFVAHLYAWAPQPEPDEDYAQFLKETGFNYERDLDHVAIAFQTAGQDSTFFAVADGRFDRQKISALARNSGTVEKHSGREIFAVPENGGTKKIYFTFLGSNRIALTDRPDLSQALSAKKRDGDDTQWRTRFERLGGSPIFAVIRQDAAPGEALSSQAPGGFRSPQVSALLDQLQWITIAGKPESDRLRVVAEGESTSAEITRQLADLLNGVLVLAESGLNDAKARQQLDPAVREAYLSLLKDADVSKLDRGDTKSVRLVFEITPDFLEAARRASTGLLGGVPAKPVPGNAAHAKKGHT